MPLKLKLILDGSTVLADMFNLSVCGNCFFEFDKDEVNIVRCPHCYHLFVRPALPDEIEYLEWKLRIMQQNAKGGR